MEILLKKGVFPYLCICGNPNEKVKTTPHRTAPPLTLIGRCRVLGMYMYVYVEVKDSPTTCLALGRDGTAVPSDRDSCWDG